ncbi:type II toxin-antitoxin system RelE/ParE family toxin [Sphingomonas sp. UYP23]
MSARWLVAARADLARIYDFNAQRSEAYAARVDAPLIERADALGRRPGMGRPWGKAGLRVLPVVDIQYVITYAMVSDRVTILRVHHARENRETP